MKELLKKYDIELSSEELEKFETLLEVFKEKNSQVNLSAIREDDDIVEKHFIDSLILNIYFDLNEQGKNLCVADIGTGGGFPLLPLAITNPQINFTGIDSVGKKLKAVQEFADKLDLTNVDTLNGRCEDIGNNLNHRENYDIVVSRATAFLPTLLEFAIPLLKTGGIFIAYKLDDKEELKSARAAFNKLNCKIEVIKSYKIADQKRTLVFIRKEKTTPKRFPRRIGEPLKNPIK